MFDVIKATTPSEARGWFALSVPISKTVGTRLGLSKTVESYGHTPAAFRQVAAKARELALGEIGGEELMSAATLQAVLRYVLAKATILERPDLRPICLQKVNDAYDADGFDTALDAFAQTYAPAHGDRTPWLASCESFLLQLALENPALLRQRELYAEEAFAAHETAKLFPARFETALSKTTESAAAAGGGLP